MVKNGSRRRFIQASGVAAVAGIAGCLGGSTGDEPTGDPEFVDVTVSLWGGPYAEFVDQHILQPFSEEAGIEISINEHSNPFDVFSQVNSGQAIHGGVFDSPSAYQAITDDMLVPLDQEIVTNLDIIEEAYQNPVWEPGDELHTVIQHIVVGGAFYNADEMDEPSTWDDILLDESLDGSIAFLANVDWYLPYMLGLSEGINLNDLADAESEAEVDAIMDPVWDKLEEIDPRVVEYTNDANIMNLMSDGTLHAGQLFGADVEAVAEDTGEPFEYVFPEDGAWGNPSPWMIFENTTDMNERYTMQHLMQASLDRERRANFVEDMPYAQAIQWDGMENAMDGHPDTVNIDNIVDPDPAVVAEYQEEWALEMQQRIGL